MRKKNHYFYFFFVTFFMFFLCAGAAAQAVNGTTAAPPVAAAEKIPAPREPVSPSAYVPTENDIKSFVYRWFAWLDHEVEDFLLLYHIAKDDLRMDMPHAVIRTHKDFSGWYARQRLEIKNNAYAVSDIKIKEQPNGHFDVEMSVRHEGQDSKGKAFQHRYRYYWQLSVSPAGRLTISRYRVKKIK